MNQFDGFECSRCSPPGGDARLHLFVIDGRWSEDEWLDETSHTDNHVLPPSAATEEAGRALIDSLFQEPSAATQEPHDAWGDLQPLVDWYIANRDSLPRRGPIRFHDAGWSARDLSQINQQLSPWIHNPESFYHSLDIEIEVQGPHGPRVRFGTLRTDLERLQEIWEENKCDNLSIPADIFS